MINIKDINFSYGKRDILKDISFDIQDNKCIAILGNNGAGKSTLIKCLNRIIPVKGGVVMVSGADLFKMPRNEVAKNIAYVAQKTETSRVTVYDAILVGRKPYIKWDITADDKKIVDDVIEHMDLEDFTLRFIDELSGGELQKVMLATIESGVVSRSYDVVLQNGTKLEFDKKGNLTEINCKQGIVPALLIPQAIKNYLKDNYAGQSVKKIEMNKNEYEVELTNGLDLTFNKHFQLIDID